MITTATLSVCHLVHVNEQHQGHPFEFIGMQHHGESHLILSEATTREEEQRARLAQETPEQYSDTLRYSPVCQ